MLQKHSEYKTKNKAKTLLEAQKYRQTEEYKQSQRKYKTSERCNDVNKIDRHNRRAIGEIDIDLWKIKCDILNNVCQICNAYLADNLVTIDHIVPVTKLGTNDIHNLQPLCGPCNARKGNKSMAEALEFHAKHEFIRNMELVKA